MAATVPRSGKMSFSNSGRRCEAHRLVVWITALARISPRGVVTLIQPSLCLSETFRTGVLACRLRFPFLSSFCRRAWTNL